MPRTWSRRPFVVYASAVVGPTLVVMALGFSAVQRQHEALEALRATNLRLQETQIGEELERMVLAAATAALDELTSGDLLSRLTSRDLADVDAARPAIDELRQRHPVIDEVFVSGEGTVHFPRTDPPLPQTTAEVLGGEPDAVRANVSRMLEEADRLQVVDPHASAELFDAVGKQARSPAVRALAMAGLARTRARSGDATGAAEVWIRVATEFTDVYSPVGRPYPVTAAVELAAMNGGSTTVIDQVRAAVVHGRWTLTPDLADYVLTRLPAPQDEQITPYLETLAFARRLRASLPGGPVGSNSAVASGVLGTPERVEQLFYVVGPERQRVAGFSANPDWIDGAVRPALAARVTPAARLQIETRGAAHRGFRPDAAAWRVSLDRADGPAGWRRTDALVFAAGTLIVLGVLVLGVVLLVRDVARETDLNRMRADLASGVSHELKTPLSVIRIHAETIDETPDMTADERRHFTAAIVQETERLRRVVDDVVDFSRIQQGQRSYSLGSGNLTPVVARAVESFRPYAELRGYSVRADIDKAVPPAVFDPVAVEQAVLNLLDNAAKYSGESMDIAVRLFATGGRVIVEVEDHGIGIEAGEQRRIFDRFYRGAHPNRGGYGLGLYLVRHIMEAHGGRVEVSSAAGQGSCFRLCFPEALVTAREGEHAEGVAG